MHRELRSLAMRFIEQTGRFWIFFLRACGGLARPPFRPALVLEQLYFVGNRSIFIICLTGAFTGLVFAVQFYFGFKIVRPDAFVGPSSAVSLARELAPVFTSIVVTGRAGAAMAAELGSMRISEQIDAMEVMAVDPIQYLVSPRVLAGLLSVPALTVLFMLIGSVGAYYAGVKTLNIDPVIFYAHLREFIRVVDVMQGLIKAAVFGIMLAALSAFFGFIAKGGAKGVGNAANTAVVVTLVLILVSDYFLTLAIRLFLYRGSNA